MHIFIDESGSFAVPSTVADSVCCMAALVIPESCLDRLVAQYGGILQRWGSGGREIKGHSLTERRVARVLSWLTNFDVVLIVVAIDMGLHNDSGVTAHKRGQAQKVRSSVASPEFFETMRIEVEDMARRIDELPNPLYVQIAMLTELFGQTLQTATLHYAQTEPAALGRFAWRIDAKDRVLTEYESLWSDIVKPLLQSRSMEINLITARDLDYSAFEPFENATLQDLPTHLREPGDAPREFNSINLRRIVEDVAFCNSEFDRGVQLADVLAATFTRACRAHCVTVGNVLVRR